MAEQSLVIDDWIKTEQGVVITAIVSSAVVLAEQKFLSPQKGDEKLKWVLTFVYDRLDELNTWPDWVDFLAKEVVINLLPGVARLVFESLDKSGVLKKALEGFDHDQS